MSEIMINTTMPYYTCVTIGEYSYKEEILNNVAYNNLLASMEPNGIFYSEEDKKYKSYWKDLSIYLEGFNSYKEAKKYLRSDD